MTNTLNIYLQNRNANGLRSGEAQLPECEASESWYAVYTHPNCEASAQFHLEGQGFKVFLPRCVKTIRHARRTKTIRAPLFPRYLFVALDLRRHRWRSINNTLGVVTLVMQEGLPTFVARGAVEALIASCNEDSVVTFLDLQPGQNVRVIAGPFAEQLGILEQFSGHKRVRVLLGMMRNLVSVEMTRAAIMPG